MSKTPNGYICPKYVKNCKRFGWICESSRDLSPVIQHCPNSKSTLPKREKETAITNLLTEYARVLNENVKLSNENAMLKANIEDYTAKIKVMENTIKEEENKFAYNLQNIQEKLVQTEYVLQDKENQLLKQNQENINKENALKNEIEILKKQLNKSKAHMEDLLEHLKNTRGKVTSYKEKLKFCVNLITEMNTFLGKVPITEKESKQSYNIDKESQTDKSLLKFSNKECNCKGCSLECENIVLSELFFKEKFFQSTLDDIFFSANQDYDDL